MHEIITLQFGQQANYLGAQFWNTQESYFTYSGQEESLIDHDVHFRSGQAPDGTDTYTPRTVIYDLKGGFGSLRKFNALYDIQHDAGSIRGLWDGSVTTQQEPAIEPSRYQNLLEQGLPTFQLQDNNVRYWSDFNRVFYHPRSAVQLSQYELNSQIMPFESWLVGEELFDQLDKGADLLDRDVRPFAEECDNMQGLQLIASADSAWGGYASKYLESLRDEYGKISMWVWGIENTTRAARQTHLMRSMNSARSLRSIGQQASAYIRLATIPSPLPRYVNLSSTSDWMTSALMCPGFESSTLPTRLSRSHSRQASLSLLEDTLNSNGSQNIYELQMSVEDPAIQADDQVANGHTNGMHEEDAGEDRAPLDIDMTTGESGFEKRIHQFARIETVRSKLGVGVEDLTLDIEENMRRRQRDETVVERYDSSLLFPTLDSYPNNLFRVDQRGPGLELTTALSTNSGTSSRVLKLRDETTRGLPVDEREALYNDLTQLANNYSFGWESGSDSGEDS